MRLWKDRFSHSCHVNIFCKTRRERAKYGEDVPELAAVKTQRPIPPEDEHRVLEFRPRASAHPTGQRAGSGGQTFGGPAFSGKIVSGPVFGAHAQPKDDWQEPDDLARYERNRDEPDDFRHRMLANLAAFAFTVALTAVGLWLAMSIADLRRTQDCVLMGRRDCVRISVPHN
jgi:hypothetical protein